MWIFYPKFMQYMDERPDQKPAQIIVPYKLPVEPIPAETETKFQKIGERYGTYGDSYGSLNTLFSGLAFGILIISLFMQRQELQAQRNELEAQRNEIKESNEIAKQQRLITEQQKLLNEQQIHDAKVQNFYTLLFRFLDEKNRKINDLELSYDSNIKGDYIFDRFFNNVLNRLKSTYFTSDLLERTSSDELELIFDDLIDVGHKVTKKLLIKSEYFEYICFILRFIEENKNLGITDNAIKIFISYQSINEMTSMFIVSLEDKELQNFICKYALLRKLNTYEADKYFIVLVDITLGEESYTP